MPRLVIAGVSSGVGKTTVTVALARALRTRGLRLALFKCGPDYLDPTYHERATGSSSRNLDGWMMGKEAVLATFAHAARGADLALIEGVMGFYDGASPTGEQGSTAEIAKWLEAPVALVVDAGGMSRSLAALVRGFVSFDLEARVAAVIANRIGGRGHLELLRSAQTFPPILGGLPVDRQHAFPERHLGLQTADASAVPEEWLDHWGALAAEGFAFDALTEIARSAPALAAPVSGSAGTTNHVCRIGVARDGAFHFYYDDNLRRLEALGAELHTFSPTRDASLPDVDGLYFGGGYPETFARELSANTPMLSAVRAFARAGGPVYAECGGLMYLTRAIVTASGERHSMVGLFSTEARMHDTLQALGYVEVETQSTTILGEAGTRFRGHEFRYSELAPAPEPPSVHCVYSVRKRRGSECFREGYRVNNVVASYVHAHWASNPNVAAAFVAACERFRCERGH
ncbi:MAG TPA: cobyrinate a,c-diamide synthase [Polyangiaceae bacterium]|nr:cobyrinate a,c-diamide synthase [Polyangiaceae bacterium]